MPLLSPRFNKCRPYFGIRQTSDGSKELVAGFTQLKDGQNHIDEVVVRVHHHVK